jgi:sortase A
MKWIGTVILAVGLLLTGWSSYQWYLGKQSVSEIPTSQTVSANSAKQNVHKEKRNETKTNNLHKSPPKKVDTLDFDYKKGQQMASLQIPSIGKQFDVFWGADEQSLKRGVGMYVSKWTTVPNLERGHTVLSGHRETVFTELGDVKDGDILTVHFDGKNYDYEVEKTWVTDAEDRSVIVEKNDATLTLTTCYPFEFLGDAPDRYIIQAKLKE